MKRLRDEQGRTTRVNQLQGAIDSNTGNILVTLDGKILFGLAPNDAMVFVAGIISLISQHPQLQPKPAPRIVIANEVPDLKLMTENWNGR